VAEITTPTTPPEAATAPSPAESPSSYRGKGMDEVFKQADAAPDKPAEVAEKTAEPEVETPPTEEQKPPETQAEPVDPDIWKMKPGQVRAALKEIPPKLRNALVDAFMKVRPYEDSGMRVSEIQHYKEIAPTPEILEDIAQEAYKHRVFNDAIASGTEEGVHHVMRSLFEASPNGAKNFVIRIASNIDKIDPPTYLGLQERGIRNLIANMRRAAKENPIFAESARDVAVFTGLERDGETETEEIKLPAEVEQEREELRQLKRQEALRQQEEMNRRSQSIHNAVNVFHETVMSGAYEAGAPMIQSWIEQYAEGYPDEVKADLFDAIGDGVVQAIDKNPAVQKRYRDVLLGGNGSPEHRARVVQYLLSQAKALLPHVATPVLQREAAKIRGVLAKRQERARTATTRRDVGASGVPAVPSRPSLKPSDFKGKGADAVFAAFDAVLK